MGESRMKLQDTRLKDEQLMLDNFELENNVYALKVFLLNKYKHIIDPSNRENENLSISDIIERIVHYYESIIFCMPGNVYWIDNKCVSVGCNKNVLDMFGFEAMSEFKGLTFEEMGKLGHWSPEAMISFKQDTMDVVRTGQAKLNIEEPIIPHNKGNLIYFLSSRVPLFDHTGHVIAVVGISIDITSRKQMEQSLKEAKEKAEIANKSKTEFLKNMRHDIRTPLSGIVGFAELLHSENNKEKIKRYTTHLVQSSKQLLKFLNEVLESINFSSGEMPLLREIFNLKSRICEVINIHRVKALEKGLSLYAIFDEMIPNYVIGDPMRIYRIVLELVGNALKFTKQGYVKVSLKLEKLDEFKIVIRIDIEDTGTGIPVEKQQELFERFNKLTVSYQNVYKGSGLGLFIVKQFVNDLDGSIYIESNNVNGTKFICLLPMQSVLTDEDFKETSNIVDRALFSEAPINLLSKKSTVPKQTVRVLVVEDQLQSSLVVQEIINCFGCSVDVADDGHKAIYLFQNNKYDLVLMDIGLPDIDGYEVTKRIRLYEQSSNSRVPIVALTAHFCIEEQQKCLESSMNAIFTKPLFKKTMIEIFQHFVPEFVIKQDEVEVQE